jgi:Flp pilus assembly pilin Flp
MGNEYKNILASKGAATKGTGMMEYGFMAGLMAITAIATISTTGVRVKELYLGLGSEVAYVNREIATINIAMDNSSGTWEIVDASVDPVEEDTASNGGGEPVADDPPAEETPEEAAPTNEEPVADQPDDGSTSEEEATPDPEPTPEPEPAPEPNAPAEDSPADSDAPQSEEPEANVEEEDAPVPEFRLTHNNGHNNAEIDFSKIDVPHRAYEFTLSGTGDTKPRVKAFSDGSETSGTTLTDRIQIRINKPAKGTIETITLIIAGQTLTWTVTHDNGGGKGKKK